ncbi:unnamed protein product [Rhizophagus irregularis]|uniref:Uncharacterized protein n=1 Tax=Rhizophagus irregularis TaxID=588596 RepID=A0A915YQV6_9GLOM|nr:unnamed protein product [Rhizophagus irregularis]
MSIIKVWIADMGLCKPADYNPSEEFSASLSQQIDVSQLNINDINHKSKDFNYEQNDDITSMEYSESLQIDISQLDINDDKL